MAVGVGWRESEADDPLELVFNLTPQVRRVQLPSIRSPEERRTVKEVTIGLY